MATIPVELGLLDWGPVSGWVGAVATFVAAFVALAVALGAFDRFRRPRLRMTFEPVEPWCRAQSREDESTVLWIRVGVENVGRRVAEGCVGRLVGVTSGDTPRRDIDPVQLRWAGVPRSRAFN